MEYAFDVALSDSWRQVSSRSFHNDSPWMRLRVLSQLLPIGYTADEYLHLVEHDLRQDWWPTASLFEVVAVEAGMRGEHQERRIRYRVQQSPDTCTVSVEEVLLVARVLPGHPHGFRVRLWICEWRVATHREQLDEILDSFRITTQPAAYYKKFMSVGGVTVKAAGNVDSAAVEAGAEIVATMLSGREDLPICMFRERAELAIIPKDEPVTSLPEFAHLQGGTESLRGRSWDILRGLGAVRGRPIASVGEEQVLGIAGPDQFYPYKGWVAVHEFAHGIQNLCFTQEDHDEWDGFYAEAQEADLYPGSYMMSNVEEFFAVFSQGYFEVTNAFGWGTTRDTLETRFPAIYSAMEEIYGGAVLPEEYRARLAWP